jgi:hypothetical protein
VQPPAPPASQSLTLPSSLTVQQIQELQSLLEQRRVLIEFRDAQPGTLYIKRSNDPADMSIGVTGVEYDNQLRVILGNLAGKAERDLEKLGINLDELQPGGDREDGDDAEDDAEDDAQDAKDLAALMAQAEATLARLKRQAAQTVPAPQEDPEDPED